MNNQRLQKREEAPRSETASNDNSPSRLAPGGCLLKGLPWAWIGLSSLATFLWLIGIGWVAVKLFRWL